MKYKRDETIVLTFHYFRSSKFYDRGCSHLPFGSFDYSIEIQGNLYEKIVKWCARFHLGELKAESAENRKIKKDLFSTQDEINKTVYELGEMPVRETWTDGKKIKTEVLKSSCSQAKRMRETYTPEQLMAWL